MFRRLWDALVMLWARWRAWRRARHPRWQVCKVMVFNGDPTEQHGYLKDITGYFLRTPVAVWYGTGWEQCVHDLTGWDTFRLEIRYTFHGRKYRMVFKNGWAFMWPPYLHPKWGPTVIHAALVPREHDGVPQDVTRRMVKYAGPMKDFHATVATVPSAADMFPFEDPAMLRETYTCVSVRDITMRNKKFYF